MNLKNKEWDVMFNFEFIKVSDLRDRSSKIFAEVNGIRDLYSHVLRAGERTFVYLSMDAVCNIIYDAKIKDVIKSSSYEVNIPMDIIDNFITMRKDDHKDISLLKDNDCYIINLNFEYNSERWNREYSIEQIVDAIEDISKKRGVLFYRFDEDDPLEGFYFYKELNLLHGENRFRDEAQSFINVVKSIFRQAYKTVMCTEYCLC